MIFRLGRLHTAEHLLSGSFNVSLEAELVTALSRTPVRNETRNRVHRLLEEETDWNLLLALATRWQVEPTVFGNLRMEFSSAMAPAVSAQAAELETRSRAYAVSRTLIVMDLVQSLTRSGVPVIVLKGPAIAILAYDDCSRRTFADADLLVSRADLRRARDLVVAGGYLPRFHREMENGLIAGQHALEFADPRTTVELHWSLVSRHLRFNLDVDAIWRQAVEIECVGSKMKTLAREHLFLYLCAHGAKHEWALFRWICDLAQLSRRLTGTQAEQVVELAERAHAKRLLSLGLRLIREIFGEEDSPFPATAFGSERETARLVSLVKQRLSSVAVPVPGLLPRRVASIHQYMEPLAFWLRSRERLTDRIACAAEFVFVPAPADRSRGQMPGVFRPMRLAANALRRLTASLR